MSWLRNVGWLWRQDDACWREDTVQRAWGVLFGGEMPAKHIRVPHTSPNGSRWCSCNTTMCSLVDWRLNPRWVAHVDVGDADFLVDWNGIVWCASYPGNERLGLLRGPGPTIRHEPSVLFTAETR